MEASIAIGHIGGNLLTHLFFGFLGGIFKDYFTFIGAGESKDGKLVTTTNY